MKEHNLQTHDNQRYSTQENTMQKHREESNANQNKFLQGKSDGRGK